MRKALIIALSVGAVLIALATASLAWLTKSEKQSKVKDSLAKARAAKAKKAEERKKEIESEISEILDNGKQDSNDSH